LEKEIFSDIFGGFFINKAQIQAKLGNFPLRKLLFSGIDK
jgi:hypothetical protein